VKKNKGDNIMAGFNPLNQIAAAIKEMASEIRNLVSRVDNLVSRVDNLVSRVDNLVSEVREIRAIVTTNQMLIKANTALIHELVHEVSRFTGKSDNLMISAFAYATRHCKAIHTGDIAKFGKMATQVSIVEGFSYERMDDPRYGSVFVYEQEALNIAFEYFFIRKQTTYTGDN
jgi:outer membrane murein-binding lipoprotein Lpp